MTDANGRNHRQFRHSLRSRKFATVQVLTLSRRKQEFESPRERQSFQHLSAKIELDPAGISNFSPMDGASDDQFEIGAVTAEPA